MSLFWMFFISYGGLSSNYFNKTLIISSIIVFHFLPLLFFSNISLTIKTKKDIFFIMISLIFMIISIQNFDYNLSYSGGGIILHLSNLLISNNLIFYMFSFFSIFILLKICNIDFSNNLLIIIILLLITPQYHIFHKYYDPLVIILFLTLMNIKINLEKFKSLNFLLTFFMFYFLLYFTHLTNNILNL